jgi:putative tricarboxylic transport membrane protein
VVANKPGGGGAIAQNYLSQAGGDGNRVYIAPTAILTNEILGKGKLGYRDFTPLAMLYEEFIGFAVLPDSPIKNAKDLLEAFKTRPETIAIAFAASAGNTNHIAAGMTARAAGGDVKKLKVVIFSSNGEAMTALLGGHVDMVVAPAGNLASNVRTGKVNAIAIAAPKRVGGELASVPTWKEAGVDAVVSSWKPLIGAKGMRPEQIAFWEAAVAKLTHSAEWTKFVERIGGFQNYMDSAQLARFLDARYQEYKSVLTELGLVK